MTARRISEVAFIALVAIVLMAPIATRSAWKMGVTLPEELAVGHERSSLEGRAYEKLPTPSMASVADKSYQESFEAYLNDIVPMRDATLLAHAALQREVITASNAPFGYDCIPTHYGSEHVYSFSNDAIAPMPLGDDAVPTKRLQTIGERLVHFAKKYDDKQFVLFVVDHANTSMANPACGLCSSTRLTSSVVNELANATSGADNVKVLSCTYETPEEYYQRFYRSDHHWNMYGTIDAYNTIADALGIESRYDAEQVYELPGIQFEGTHARRGLMPMSEETFDVALDFSTVNLVRRKDGERCRGDDHSLFYEKPKSARLVQFYGDYFGPMLRHSRAEGPGSTSAVLIADSYGYPLIRLLALQYGTLRLEYDLHADFKEVDVRFEERIRDKDIDTVIMVAFPTNYSYQPGKMPHYFDDMSS